MMQEQENRDGCPQAELSPEEKHMEWQKEAAILNEYAAQHEKKTKRRTRSVLAAIVSALLIFAVVATVTLVKFSRYCKAANYYTAGEYQRAADAFMEMADYRDAKSRVYWSAVELYKQKEYEKALPYLEWLDGYMDQGYYLRRCREKLGLEP